MISEGILETIPTPRTDELVHTIRFEMEPQFDPDVFAAALRAGRFTLAVRQVHAEEWRGC